MLALRYEFAPPRWLAARYVGGRVPGLAVDLSGLRLRRLPCPVAPGPKWTRVRVRMAGICGTDIATLRGRSGPQLSPFVSFPAVLGHELLGVAVGGRLAGRRVVADPFLGCRARGLPPCDACARGQTALCQRFAEGALAPGMLLGYCRDLPGAWSEEVVVHEDALFAVPDGVPDRAALLAEPLAVALHAVLAVTCAPQSRVLVIGAGAVGLCLLAALRLTESPVQAVAIARHPAQRRWARALGATVVPDLSAAAQLSLERGWSTSYPGVMGARATTGGYDRVFDAVGSSRTLGAALRLVRAGGRVDLLGCSGVVPELDLTWLWAHEVQLQGFCGYGLEPAAGERHTIAVALELLADRPDLRLGDLVTHRFPLERHREALAAAFFHRRSGSIKVAFALDSAGPDDRAPSNS